MSLPIISKPQFPDVPQLPGVPQIVRQVVSQATTTQESAQSAIARSQALVQLAKLNAASRGQNFTWGIYDPNSGLPVVEPDNIYSFDYRDEYSLPNAPLQQGSFTGYNKVTRPYEIGVRLTKGGTLAARTEFERDLDAIVGDTNLYVIVTPERTYENANITRRGMTRTSSAGAYFLEVDVYFQQILQGSATYASTTTPDTSNATDPAARPSVSNGNVQPSTSVLTQAASKAKTAITNLVR